MLKLKDRESEIKKVNDALLSMKGKIDVLKDIQVEMNIRKGAASYDLIFFTKFDSLDDIDVYINDPVPPGSGEADWQYDRFPDSCLL